MIELLPLLKTFLTTPGLSGYESSIRQEVKNAWLPLCDEIETSRIGSLHALKRGTAQAPRPSMLIAAHMDEIGLMVTGITNGFLRITEIGGIDPRILPGQSVIIHGKKEITGVVVQPPVQLLPSDVQSGPLPLQYLLVDTGLDAYQVHRLVKVGDRISFAQSPVDFSEDTLVGHAMDNRVSLAAITYCLQELKNRQLQWDFWAVASVQEEETLGGALTSGFQLRPSLAIIVDVTFGSSPGSPAHKTFPIGKGITLGWGPTVHPFLYEQFKKLADELEIPHAVEVIPRLSATDADTLQTTAEGVPTMIISIPLRYMHTPVEMVSLKDITRTGRLMAEFASRLDMEFLKKIKWDE
ncbi:MAG: M42 family metallopeptidase [Chloroflexi bacterium]|nr:M42 family metallopeptidase [Chloroflexota bacterium]